MNNNYKNLDFSAFNQTSKATIESYYLRAIQGHKLFDPEFQTLITEGIQPALCSVDAALGHCKKWLLEIRKRPQVASFFTKTVQESDVQVNIGTIKVKGEIISPVCGSLDPVFKISQNIYARDVANILVLHTTHKSSLDEWITIEKAAEVGIPYIDCVNARRLLNVVGNDNFITRDMIYSKLIGDLPADWCLLIYCMSVIYSNPSLRRYTDESPGLLNYYKTYKPVKFPDIKVIRVPKLTVPEFSYPAPYEAIFYLSIKSGQLLGDVRKRGVISSGYYRFEMPSSEIKIMEEATDIIMICDKFGFEAVKTHSMNQVLYSILVKNGISVYTTHSSMVQPGRKAGVWGTGKMKSFSWGIYHQEVPKIMGEKAVCPGPILSRGRNEPFFNYVYIPEKHDPELQYVPSVGAATGLCIATNVKVQGVLLSDLLKRFCKAQIFRNMFPYTRLTFVNQDIFRSWFMTPWTFPKKTERGVRDVFAGAVEEVIQIDPDASDYKVYGMIVSEPSIPTPAQKGKQELLESLHKYSTESLVFVTRKINGGEFVLEDDFLDSIYAVMSSVDFLDIINYEIRERERYRRSNGGAAPPEPEIPVNSDNSSEPATSGEVPLPPAAARNPFEDCTKSNFKLIDEQGVSSDVSDINKGPPPTGPPTH